MLNCNIVNKIKKNIFVYRDYHIEVKYYCNI